MEIHKQKFVIGQKVRIAPYDGDPKNSWREDWQDPSIELYVIGVMLEPTGKLNYIISEDWPKDRGTDTFEEDLIEA